MVERSKETITLKEYVDARFEDSAKAVDVARDAVEKTLTARLEASEKAIDLARVAVEKRLDTMNEFRQSLKDQASLFYTRDEHNAYQTRMDDVIVELRKAKDTAEGKASMVAVYFSYGLAILSVVVAVALHFIH